VIFGRNRKNKTKTDDQVVSGAVDGDPEQSARQVVETAVDPEESDALDSAEQPGERRGIFARLGRTREALGSGISKLLGGGAKIDESLFNELEDQLLSADVGIDATMTLVEKVRDRASKEKIEHAPDLKNIVREEMLNILTEPMKSTATGVETNPSGNKPHILLMVGVNGVGKTTSVAKLAARAKAEGNTVLVAAADTFRAAAIEQLQNWGERLDIPVVSQAHGSDAAAVAHDAVSSAVARAADLLIIDTAGRQHTHGDLMEQLAKIVRVIRKVDETAPHDTYIVVDAGNGQNILSQIEQFSTMVPITGVVITKLDGTAKGGVVLAVASKLGLPVCYIGVGEGVDDLRQFDAEDFVQALLPE